jgi:hypothetical protein
LPIGQAHPWENRPGHLLIRSTESPDGPPLAVLRLRRLWATPEAINEALHRFAGRRWSTEIRRNNGVVKDDANALLLQGRNEPHRSERRRGPRGRIGDRRRIPHLDQFTLRVDADGLTRLRI